MIIKPVRFAWTVEGGSGPLRLEDTEKLELSKDTGRVGTWARRASPDHLHDQWDQWEVHGDYEFVIPCSCILSSPHPQVERCDHTRQALFKSNITVDKTHVSTNNAVDIPRFTGEHALGLASTVSGKWS